MNTGLAGELCEGFHVHPFHSVRYLQDVILPNIKAGAQQAARNMQDITVSVTAFSAAAPEEEAFARMQIAFYTSTLSYRSVMDLHGWGATASGRLRRYPTVPEVLQISRHRTWLIYPTLGLVNEAGEVAGKIKKICRDKDADRDALKAEPGNILWYSAQVTAELDLSLDEIAEYNVAKLRDRQAQGQIKGDGNKW